MPRDYKQFFAICKKHGFNKEDTVSEFTGGRTSSLRELSDGEFKELMLRLRRINEPLRQDFTPKPGDEQRKKFIAIARNMRWDMEGKKNMLERIDNWCIKHTKYHKKLNELTVEELNKALYIFEYGVKASFYKGLNKV